MALTKKSVCHNNIIMVDFLVKWSHIVDLYIPSFVEILLQHSLIMVGFLVKRSHIVDLYIHTFICRDFVATLPRPFVLIYDAQSQCVKKL